MAQKRPWHRADNRDCPWAMGGSTCECEPLSNEAYVNLFIDGKHISEMSNDQVGAAIEQIAEEMKRRGLPLLARGLREFGGVIRAGKEFNV